MFFQHGDTKNASILSTCTWSPAVISAILYCHSNLLASLSISRSGKGIESASATWVWFSNGTLIGLLVFYFAVTVPLACSSNSLQNTAIDKSKELIVLLTTAGQTVATGGNPAAYVPQIAAIKADLVDLAARAKVRSLAVVGIAIVYAFFYAFATVATLSFVYKLRKQAQWNRTRNTNAMPTSVMVHREQQTIIEGDGAAGLPVVSYAAPAGIQKAPDTPFSDSTKAKSTRKTAFKDQTEEQAALTRLSWDLAISTPLVMALAFWFIFVGIFGATNKSKSITIIEFKADSFRWPELLLNSLILFFFNFSLWKSPGRYGQSSDISASAAPESSGSKGFIRMQPFGQAQPGPVAPFEFSTVNFDAREDDVSAEKEKW